MGHFKSFFCYKWKWEANFAGKIVQIEVYLLPIWEPPVSDDFALVSWEESSEGMSHHTDPNWLGHLLWSSRIKGRNEKPINRTFSTHNWIKHSWTKWINNTTAEPFFLDLLLVFDPLMTCPTFGPSSSNLSLNLFRQRVLPALGLVHTYVFISLA